MLLRRLVRKTNKIGPRLYASLPSPVQDGPSGPALEDPSLNLTPSLSDLADASLFPTSLKRFVTPLDPKLGEDDYYNVGELVHVDDLLACRAHLGHKLGTVNPRMIGYLFGHRMGQCIFDLQQTFEHFTRALNFTAHTAHRGGIILFVSCNTPVTEMVERTAQECGEYAYTRRWKTGLFVDSKKKYGSVVRLPDLVILTNTLCNAFEQHPICTEAAKLLIPTVGVVDSNCDPSLITYPIPANDDTVITVGYFLKLFQKAILRGKDQRKNVAAAGEERYFVPAQEMEKLRGEERIKLEGIQKNMDLEDFDTKSNDLLMNFMQSGSKMKPEGLEANMDLEDFDPKSNDLLVNFMRSGRKVEGKGKDDGDDSSSDSDAGDVGKGEHKELNQKDLDALFELIKK